MNTNFWEMLVTMAKPGQVENLSPALKNRLRTLSDELGLVLNNSESAAKSEILTRVCAEVITHIGDLESAMGASKLPPIPSELGFTRVPIDPEILEWARQNIDEEEIMAGIREIEETGGVQLEDFIEELKKATADG